MRRVRLLDRALDARDEPTGFVHACALVRPARVITGMSASSMRKKLKDKGVARTANREDVHRGTVELGVGLDEHLAFMVAALDAIAPEIGLAREPT